MAGRLELRPMISAGALTELLLSGYIADMGGRVRARSAESRPQDPVLADFLSKIAASQPRSWHHWLSHGSRTLPGQIRDALAEDGIVQLDRRRILGVAPITRVTVPDVLAIKRLTQRVASALNESLPAARVAPRDAALVSLTAQAELRTVMPRNRRRTHRRRISELGEVAEPVPGALRRAIRRARTAAYGGG
jgi:hypothetical protein